MWNIGKGQGSNIDLTQGLGLAMFSHVIGVKGIERQIKKYSDMMAKAQKMTQLDKRIEEQQRIL